MKRLMMTTLVMVVLIGIGTDVANAQINWSGIARTEMIRHSSGRFPLIGGRIGGRIGGSQINWSGIARTEMIRHSSGRFPLIGGYGGYGYGRDRTLRRVTGYGELALGVVQLFHENSIDNRLVNYQISMDNQAMDIARRRQALEEQQIRAQRGTVLVQRGPIVLQVKKPKAQKNQQLRQEIEALKIQLKKLQQQVGK